MASVAGVVRRLLAVARGRLLGGGLVALGGVLGRVLKYIAKVKKMFVVGLRAVNCLCHAYLMGSSSTVTEQNTTP